MKQSEKVYDLLLAEQTPLTSAEIAAAVNLSIKTVSSVLNDLREMGLVRTAGMCRLHKQGRASFLWIPTKSN